jgi:hypothetical protein
LLRDGAHNPKLAEDLGRLRDEILLVLRSVSSQPGAMGRGVLRFVLGSTFEAAIM